MLASGAPRSSWTASVPWRLLVSALGHGRPAIVATAPVVWLAVTFLPDIHPALRLSSWLATAAVIGLGAELAAHAAAPEAVWRRGWGTFWFVPAGTALLAIIWFSVFPDRPRSLAPLAVVAVIGTMLVQRAEVNGLQAVRAGAHAITIGLAFAIAFVVYAASAHADTVWKLPLVATASAFAASILLRDARAGRAAGLGLVGATAIVVGELALILSSTAAAPWVCGALLVLALYAASGVCHAVLDGAPRHVYLELALVTGAGLIFVGLGATRAWPLG